MALAGLIQRFLNELGQMFQYNGRKESILFYVYLTICFRSRLPAVLSGDRPPPRSLCSTLPPPRPVGETELPVA